MTMACASALSIGSSKEVFVYLPDPLEQLAQLDQTRLDELVGFLDSRCKNALRIYVSVEAIVLSEDLDDRAPSAANARASRVGALLRSRVRPDSIFESGWNPVTLGPQVNKFHEELVRKPGAVRALVYCVGV